LKIQRLLMAGGLGAVLLVCNSSGISETSSDGLQVSPTGIDFGQDAVSSDSQPRTITVSNPTKAPITIQQILASGIDFTEKNDCGQTLAPGAQCTIQVFFTPAISGPRTGNLQVVGSDGAPHFVALNGNGK
jgi:hypothetical protein